MSKGPDWRCTNEWKAIERDNRILFTDAITQYVKNYSYFVSVFSLNTKTSKIFSEIRYEEFIRSCTDDLYRYATYHPVKKGNGEFLIQESVRASYITKWLMMFKPLILDVILSLVDKNEVNKYLADEDIETAYNFFRKSNELFAIYFASATLKLKKKKDAKEKEFVLLTDFFDFNIIEEYNHKQKEYKDFMYALRYRLPSQDVYRPIYRRLEAMSVK